MKRLFLLAAIAILAISCQKDPIGSTVAKDVAGEWSVKYNAVNDNGELVDTDVLGGYSRVFTFNTSANATDTIYIADEEYFIGYQAKIPCKLEQKTFGSEDVLDNLYGSSAYHGPQMIVDKGIIIPGAATTPSGMPADSIYFELTFVGGDYFTSMYASYGMEFTHYQVGGFRFTGFEGDQDGF